MANMQHRDDAPGLVNGMDDPVAGSPTPIKRLAKFAIFRRRRTSGRMFVEA
jgi:hypothetical protein